MQSQSIKNQSINNNANFNELDVFGSLAFEKKMKVEAK
jgi:hypothetical protein